MRSITLFVFLAASALAQNAAAPSFEVASVKINPQFRQDDRSTWSRTFDTSPGSLTFRNVSLTMIVAWAYNLQWPQIVGPAGMDFQRYDILAKRGQPARDDEMRLMLQVLLAERFKLVVHRETRQLEALALLLPKGGHRMTESKVEGATRNRQDPDRGTVVEGALLMDLASELARETPVPIVDMTGLKGRFDFAFNPQKYVSALRSQVMADPQRAPSEAELHLTLLQNVLEGELGLKLESRKAPVDLLVIDHVEKSPVASGSGNILRTLVVYPCNPPQLNDRRRVTSHQGRGHWDAKTGCRRLSVDGSRVCSLWPDLRGSQRESQPTIPPGRRGQPPFQDRHLSGQPHHV